MSEANTKNKPRARILRSKFGCRTCRIRKVKCDERHPSCGKCASTGRTCEWFPSEPHNTRETSIERCRIQPVADASILERRSFDFFSSRTVRDLAWLFDSDLWEFTILQLSQSEKALRHAAVALSSLQEAEETYGMPISKDRAGDVRHRFAARHYNLAIHYLSQGMSAGAENARITTLITCLVFIHIELLRGRYEESLTHLRSGLQILEGGKSGTPGDNDALEEEIRRAFQKLDLQSAHFGEPTPRPRLVLSEPKATTPGFPSLPPFSNLPEAKDQCDILMSKSFHFIATCGEYTREERTQYEQQLLARQAELNDLHSVYLQTLIELINTPTGLSPKDRRGAMMLRAHLIASIIHLATCLAPNSDTLFDQHLAGFKDVVALSESLISDFSSTASSPQSPGCKIISKQRMPTFLTDWGVVLPLYFVAIKCRDSPTRHAALNALDSWRHREGFWDSALAHRIASQVVQMEEVGILGSGVVKIPDDVDGDPESEPRAYLGTTTNASSEKRKKAMVVQESVGADELPGQVRIGNTFVNISEDQQHITFRVTRKLWHAEGDNIQPDGSKDEEEGWVTENYQLTLLYLPIAGASSLFIFAHKMSSRAGDNAPHGGHEAAPTPAPQGTWKATWSNNKGLIFIILAQAIASSMDAIVRFLQQGEHKMHPFQIIFARMSTTFVLSSLYMWWTKVPDFPLGRPDVRGWLVVRALFGFFGLFCLYYSVHYLPLAEATVFRFLVPIVTAWACSIFLGEIFSS
ncbi:hypothetical protein O988_07309, partial [Pseudogymnoascus sp. VKM F-3808]